MARVGCGPSRGWVRVEKGGKRTAVLSLLRTEIPASPAASICSWYNTRRIVGRCCGVSNAAELACRRLLVLSLSRTSHYLQFCKSRGRPAGHQKFHFTTNWQNEIGLANNRIKHKHHLVSLCNTCQKINFISALQFLTLALHHQEQYVLHL